MGSRHLEVPQLLGVTLVERVTVVVVGTEQLHLKDMAVRLTVAGTLTQLPPRKEVATHNSKAMHPGPVLPLMEVM